MANSPQSRKRARQAETRRQRNASQRSRVRTTIKKVRSAIDSGDAKAAAEALDAAVPVIDRMANRGIMHPKPSRPPQVPIERRHQEHRPESRLRLILNAGQTSTKLSRCISSGSRT